MIGNDADRPIGTGQQQELQACAGPVALTKGLIALVRRDVLERTIALFCKHRCTVGQHAVLNGAANAGFQAGRVVFAQSQFKIRFRLEAWGLGDDVDDTQCGVLAEQGALGAAQDLNVIEVGKVAP